MSASFRTTVFVLIVFSLGMNRAHAQSYLYATGIPTSSTTLPIDHGIVNVSNGNIHIEIPLANKLQRGSFALNERLLYDSRIWKIVQSGSSYSWQPTNVTGSIGGWSFSSGAGLGNITYVTISNTDYNPPSCTQGSGGNSGQQYDQYYGWQWTDPDGTTHSFPGATTVKYLPMQDPHCFGNSPGIPSSNAMASDGSGYSISVSNYTNATITDLQGRTYTPQATGSNIVDTNGNYWNTDSNGNLVDTGGLTPVLVSTNGNSTYYDVLSVGGVRQRYTVTLAPVYYNTSFGEQDVSEASGSFSAIQSIALPDGTSYQFTYYSGTAQGSPGELKSMTLPTGGTVGFDYETYTDSFNNANMWLTGIDRDGAHTAFTPQVISNCGSGGGCQEQVTVTPPDGNATVYKFLLDRDTSAVSGSSWLNSVQRYSGYAPSGTLLSSVSPTYTYNTAYTQIYDAPSHSLRSGGAYTYPASLTITTTLADINSSTSTTTNYVPFTALPAETKVWDFGVPVSSAPLTDTVYGTYWCGNPSSVIVNDGSGNFIWKVTYGFNETTPTATSSVPQHVAASHQCNITSMHQSINASSTIDTTVTYDDAGAVLARTDSNGTTTYTYDTSDTFAVITQLPTPSSGAALSTGATFDASTGVPTSQTDMNGTQTVYSSFDNLNRPQEIDTKDINNNLIGKTTFTYAPNQLSQFSYQNSSVRTDRETLFDGYGRVSRTALANGQTSNPWYQSDTCYDGNSRVNFLSTSYQGNEWRTAKVCSNTGTATTFDAMGRVQSVTNADGTQHFTYKGRATQATGVNGVQTISQIDALGRTSAVCEISSNSSMPNSGSPQSCAMDIAGTGFLTSFSYDLANHKMTVVQGAQQRTFTTDAAGRNIDDVEPERGETTYSYAYNSIGLLVSRTRPAPNQTNAATLVTTATQYDSLGRVVSVSYNGTVGKNFTYDVGAGPGWSDFTQTNLKGRLSTGWVPGGAASSFGYDAVGRISYLDSCFPSTCGTVAYNLLQHSTYDWAGNLSTSTDAAGNTTMYNVTVANEVSPVSTSLSGSGSSINLVSSVQNGPYGPVSYTLGNGLNVVTGYDSLGRQNGGWVCSGSQAPNCSNGNQVYGFSTSWKGAQLASSTDSVLNQTSSYGYDEFSRLTSRTVNSGTSQNLSWTYDRYGNRLSQNILSGSGLSASFQPNVTTNQNSSLPYDAAGNVQGDGFNGYTYDGEGNLIQVTGGGSAQFVYDAFNRRIQTTVGSTVRQFAFNSSGQRVSVWDGSTHTQLQSQYYWGGKPVAYYAANAAHFQHQDWLGTERMRTTSSGAVEGTFTSLPFGDLKQAAGTDGDSYHFASLDADTESTTDHAQFRQYENMQGRWLSPDPYDGSMDPADPQSLNRYSYVGNMPLSYSDLSGLQANDPCHGDPTGCGSGGHDCGLACIGITLGVGALIEGIESLFNHPSFNGSLHSRPPSAITQDVNGVYHMTAYGQTNSPPWALELFSASSTSLLAPNRLTPANPCAFQGKAQSPQEYARLGATASAYGPAIFAGYSALGFPRGSFLDAQPKAGIGSVFDSYSGLERAAYGNYIFGDYMAAAGVPLSVTLNIANLFGATSTYSAKNGPMSTTYNNLPQANVTNITNGYTAFMNGTLCHR